MQREMDLCRGILLEIEKYPTPLAHDGTFIVQIPPYTEEQIWYHIKLLNQAGLIEAVDWTTRTKPEWLAKDLTWQGHEFLDAFRGNSVWQKAKRLLMQTVGTVALEGVRQLVPQLISEGLKKIE